MVTITVRPLRDTFFTDRITMAAALASKPAKVNRCIRLEILMDQVSNMQGPIMGSRMNMQLYMQCSRASCAQPAQQKQWHVFLLTLLTCQPHTMHHY